MAPVIETRSLSKFYGSQRGIEDLNLSVGAGEIFGYLGPNGSGKTTTIRLMLGFIRPTSGKLTLFEQTPLRGARSLRRKIGYLPGELGLYENYTGNRLLNLYSALSGKGAPLRDYLCDALAFTPEDRKRKIKAYSKGMKHKLAIVQAIQHDPDLIILDEPTDGLDPLVQMSFAEILREMKRRGKTIFLSSHVLSEVHRLCDRVGVLRDGKLILTAGIQDLTASAERRLWVRIPGFPVTETQASPVIRGASFLRREGDWFIYSAAPGDSAGVLSDLAQLRPADFRFESAFEDSFLSLYRGAGLR